MRFYAPRLCRSQTDSPSSTDVHAPLRRRATELSAFSEAVMVFLVFLEVPEMSLEVAGPGPTHGRSNLRVLTWDLLLVPSRPMPDACYPLVLFVVCGGGFLQGRRLGGAPNRPCSCSTRFNSLQVV